MHSAQNPKQPDDPHDFIVVAPDVVGVAPDAAEAAPADDELSSLLKEAARRSSNRQTQAAPGGPGGAPVPPIDTTFRPVFASDGRVPGEQRSIGKLAARAVMALLLAACIGAAAMGWQSSGSVARQMIAEWMPKSVLSLLPREKPGLPAQPNPPAVQQAAAVSAAPSQPVPSAQQAAPESVAVAAAPSPAESQRLEAMARDLATMGQEIEQLKASIEQLKAGQEQMSRDIARTTAQNVRPRVSAPPPRPVAAAQVRRPVPPFPPPQAAAAPVLSQAAVPSAPPAPQPEAQPPAAAESQAEPVLRPPMPVR